MPVKMFDVVASKSIGLLRKQSLRPAVKLLGISLGLIAVVVPVAGELVVEWRKGWGLTKSDFSMFDLANTWSRIYWSLFAGMAFGMIYVIYENTTDKVEYEYVPTQDEVYGSMMTALKQAKHSVRTTHLRNRALQNIAPASGAAKKFQDAVHGWVCAASGTDDRQLRRLVSTKTEEMSITAASMIAVADALANYTVRAIDWPLQTPAVNLLIVDDSVAFVCFYNAGDDHQPDFGSAKESELRAIRVTRAECVKEWIKYYDALFNDKKVVTEKDVIPFIAAKLKTMPSDERKKVKAEVDRVLQKFDLRRNAVIDAALA